jgi:hypothetical protein
MIKSIVRLHLLLLQDVMKTALIKAALIVRRICDHSVHNSSVDYSANYAVDINNLFALHLCRGRTKIRFQRTKFICRCILHCRRNASCIRRNVVFHLLDQALVGPYTLLFVWTTDNSGWQLLGGQ